MVIEVKKLNPNAKFPEQAYEGDFCYDVVATSCEHAKDSAGNPIENVYKYGIGLAFRVVRGGVCTGYNDVVSDNNDETRKLMSSVIIPIDNLRVSIDIRPRSSIYKTGLVLCNTPGTVDEKYRGEVMCMFRHVDKSLPIYKVGDKIAQICLSFTVPIEFKEIDDFGDEGNIRGAKGFGSSDSIKKFAESDKVTTQEIIVEGYDEPLKFYVKDGWMVNPNQTVVKGILKGLKRKDGLCPCHHPESDGDLRCPCESYRDRDKCCCNLYVKKE